MEESQLIHQLGVIRGTIRRRLVAYGGCVLLAGSVAVFLAIVLLDWLLRFPPLLRLLIAGASGAGLLAAVYHWIIRPIRAGPGLVEIAARLETRLRMPPDELSSSVDFLERGAFDAEGGSAGMMRAAIAHAERAVTPRSVASALSLRPLLRQTAGLIASAVVLASLVWVWPQGVRTGLVRYVDPWGGVDWPRSVSILPLTVSKTIALGDSVTVRMKIQRGLKRTLRGRTHVRFTDGETAALTMHRNPDGVFSATIDAVTRDLTYWFEAGDDDTAADARTVRVVRPPEVLRAVAEVEPPPYARRHAIHTEDLTRAPVRAPIGGHVTITVQASKPIPDEAPGGSVGLQPETGAFIPLLIDPSDRRKLSARIAVRQDVHFEVKLRDEHGFTNRGPARFSILVAPDEPPVAAILEPSGVAELTPRGSVELLIRAEDDFGIRRLDLDVERWPGPESFVLPLTERLPADPPVRPSGGVVLVTPFLWSVESLSLSPGDVLVYTAVATDNRSADGMTPQVGRSAPMRLRIVSDAEFDTRLRSDLSVLEASVRRVALDQADLLDRTSVLRSAGDPCPSDRRASPAGRKERRAAAAQLAARERRLVRRSRELADRFDKNAERRRRNPPEPAAPHDGQEEIHHLASLAFRLRTIATGPMGAAADALVSLREQAATDEPEALGRAVDAQREASDQLQALLRAFAQWDDFRNVVSRTDDLRQRQDALRINTTELGKSLLGKPVETLTERDAVRLSRLARKQQQLGVDVEQLLARMKQLAGATKEEDPAGADVLDAALRAARAGEVNRHLVRAAKAITANRTAAAAIAQQQAGSALRRMLEALYERDRRQLEELHKHLAQARRQITTLIEQQRDLRAATREAGLLGGKDSPWPLLAREQRRLKRNTRQLGSQLADTFRTAAASTLVRDAAGPMDRAETYLRESRSGAATGEQDAALELLVSARARLQETASQTDKELLLRTLAAIRNDLDEILAGQTQIKDGVDKLVRCLSMEGRLRRSEARAAARLARRQAEVRAMVSAEARDFEKVIVFKWALARVATWMETGQTRLRQRRIDEDLLSVNRRIIRELERLIQAVVDTESLPPDTEFIESSGAGGGGPGGDAREKPVPTVAELLVLKAMQVDINERTRSVHDSFDVEHAGEAQLRRIRALGEDQAELRRLTRMVIDRARQP